MAEFKIFVTAYIIIASLVTYQIGLESQRNRKRLFFHENISNSLIFELL